MFQEERLQTIYKLVSEQQSIRVSELSQLLQISDATVRRDLEELQQRGTLMRTHGGAMLPYSVGHDMQVDKLQMKNVEEKRLIANAALGFIRDNDTLLIDSSSTALELAQLLTQCDRKGLSVITMSLQVVQALKSCENMQVILIGGKVNYGQLSMDGYAAVRFLQNLRVDKCFIGVNGINAEFGFSTPHLEDAEMKAASISASCVSYVLADHTKFGKAYFASIPMVDYLITDTRIPDFDYDSLEKKLILYFADNLLQKGAETV